MSTNSVMNVPMSHRAAPPVSGASSRSHSWTKIRKAPHGSACQRRQWVSNQARMLICWPAGRTVPKANNDAIMSSESQKSMSMRQPYGGHEPRRYALTNPGFSAGNRHIGD